MHCPKCGQKQVSANIKYCSRCGFHLRLVAELLANGGSLPRLASLAKNRSLFNKKNGVFLSAFWFILFTLFLTSVAGILDLGELPGLTAVTGVFGAILILISSLVFLPSSKTTTSDSWNDSVVGADPNPVSLHGSGGMGQLPSGTPHPASVYTAPQGSWRVPDTGDLVTPGSVTEGTTKLLAEEEER